MNCMKRSCLAPLLAACLFCLPAPPLAAESGNIDRQEAAAIARQAFPGRVLAVKAVGRDKRAAWRVKTLDEQGNVHIVVIDASNGRILSGR